MQKITPFLWFNDKEEEAMKFYTSIFKNSKIKNVTRYGDAGPGSKGSVMTAGFLLEGQEFVALNGGPIFTFTPAIRTRSTFPWHNTTHIQDVEKEVLELKRRFAREVQVHGSCGLAQTLIQKDLIDEYRILKFPVILGTGKRLFGTGAVPRTLKLVRSSTTSTGVIISVYRPAGSLKTGSFALE